MKKLILLVAMTGAMSATLAGCNTIAGLGDDVSAGARATQRVFN